MFEPNSLIGTYRVIRLLGKGGMGAVYEVEHIQLGVHYALKTFTLDDEDRDVFIRRFATEGRMLARLKHPNLTSVFDLQQDRATGTMYYVMDLVLYKDGEARTLSDIEQGGADEDWIYEWFRQMCDALSYVHSQGIVHRDIKLNNILLRPDHSIVLSDFGISRIFNDNLRDELHASRTMTSATSGRMIVGTQGYMPPEVLRGETATPAADVYALGVVFFKLLTGVWYDPDLEHIDGHANQEPYTTRLLSYFERPWKDVLPRMLASDPEQRPTDLDSLPELLRLSADSAKRRKGRSRTTPTWLIAASIATIVAVTAIGTVWFFTRTQPPADDDRLIAEAFSVPENV